MTQETPAKVFSLLGVALTSMFFLFAVSATNASFSQTEKPFPDTFNPDKIVSMLDNVSSSYADFVHENLVVPGENSYAVYQYNLKFVIDNASPAILAYTGLTSLAEVPAQTPSSQQQVAGAFTMAPAQASYQPTSQGFSVDTIYNMLNIR